MSIFYFRFVTFQKLSLNKRGIYFPFTTNWFFNVKPCFCTQTFTMDVVFAAISFLHLPKQCTYTKVNCYFCRILCMRESSSFLGMYSLSWLYANNILWIASLTQHDRIGKKCRLLLFSAQFGSWLDIIKATCFSCRLLML